MAENVKLYISGMNYQTGFIGEYAITERNSEHIQHHYPNVHIEVIETNTIKLPVKFDTISTDISIKLGLL